MKNLLIILTLFLQPNKSVTNMEKMYYQEMIHHSSPQGVKNAVNSSVMIQAISETNNPSMGSGNLVKIGVTDLDFGGDGIDLIFKDVEVVLTAQHVINGAVALVVIERNGNIIPAEVIYQDKEKDIAAIVLKRPVTMTESIKLKQKRDNKIGKEVYHCGHPSVISFNLSEGIITSLQEGHVITNSFSLPGSSGSVVFGKRGDVIGIVVSIGFDHPFGMPELIEEVVRVTLLDYLDIQGIVEAVENGRTGNQSGDNTN